MQTEIIVVKNDFDDKVCDWLLHNHRYSFYQLSVRICGIQSVKAILRFMDKIEYFPENLFDSLTLKMNFEIMELCQKVIDVYHSKGLKQENLLIEKANTSITEFRESVLVGRQDKYPYVTSMVLRK